MNQSAMNLLRQLAALHKIEIDVASVTTSRNIDRLMTIATMLFLDSKVVYARKPAKPFHSPW